MTHALFSNNTQKMSESRQKLKSTHPIIAKNGPKIIGCKIELSESALTFQQIYLSSERG